MLSGGFEEGRQGLFFGGGHAGVVMSALLLQAVHREVRARIGDSLSLSRCNSFCGPVELLRSFPPGLEKRYRTRRSVARGGKGCGFVGGLRGGRVGWMLTFRLRGFSMISARITLHLCHQPVRAPWRQPPVNLVSPVLSEPTWCPHTLSGKDVSGRHQGVDSLRPAKQCRH